MDCCFSLFIYSLTLTKQFHYKLVDVLHFSISLTFTNIFSFQIHLRNKKNSLTYQCSDLRKICRETGNFKFPVTSFLNNINSLSWKCTATVILLHRNQFLERIKQL